MRVLLAVLLVGLAVAAAALLAGHPGQVEIVWLRWQIETSVGVLIAVIALIAAIASLLALLVAGLRRAPRALRRARTARRRRAGEMALTRGLVALSAGDETEARRHAERAAVLLDASPTARLLAAEAATRQGDEAAARQAYATLLEHRDSEFLGLRGLLGQAVRAGDDAAALHFAERARQLRPRTTWLIENLVQLQARSGEWRAVHDTLARAARRGGLASDTARRQRGIALYELSHAAERQGDLRQAAGLAAKAQALAPEIAAVADRHARLLIGLGRKRTAAKAIERAWRRAPHPDLARAYADIAADAAPTARAAALQRLAKNNPEAIESRLALAEAALDAQLWGEARRHLDLAGAGGGAAAAPERSEHLSRRLCLAMARLEESGSANLAEARRWLDLALKALPDPEHVCRRCGAASPQWQPLCRVCGGFDTLRRRTSDDNAPVVLPSTDVPALAAPLTLPAPELHRARPSLAQTPQSDN
jgi:HemY protein